jgi:excisionase family DNA binding protein
MAKKKTRAGKAPRAAASSDEDEGSLSDEELHAIDGLSVEERRKIDAMMAPIYANDMKLLDEEQGQVAELRRLMGQRFKQDREQRYKVSQRAFGEMFGKSGQWVNAIEQGRQWIPHEVLHALAFNNGQGQEPPVAKDRIGHLAWFFGLEWKVREQPPPQTAEQEAEMHKLIAGLQSRVRRDTLEAYFAECKGAEPVRAEVAAARLGLGLRKVWELIAEGKLEAVRDGARSTRVTLESVERFRSDDVYAELRRTWASERQAAVRLEIEGHVCGLAAIGNASPELAAEVLHEVQRALDRLAPTRSGAAGEPRKA